MESLQPTSQRINWPIILNNQGNIPFQLQNLLSIPNSQTVIQGSPKATPDVDPETFEDRIYTKSTDYNTKESKEIPHSTKSSELDSTIDLTNHEIEIKEGDAVKEAEWTGDVVTFNKQSGTGTIRRRDNKVIFFRISKVKPQTLLALHPGLFVSFNTEVKTNKTADPLNPTYLIARDISHDIDGNPSIQKVGFRQILRTLFLKHYIDKLAIDVLRIIAANDKSSSEEYTDICRIYLYTVIGEVNATDEDQERFEKLICVVIKQVTEWIHRKPDNVSLFDFSSNLCNLFPPSETDSIIPNQDTQPDNIQEKPETIIKTQDSNEIQNCGKQKPLKNKQQKESKEPDYNLRSKDKQTTD